MKAENLPIKVECFRVRDRGHLDAIGYILIPLRNIPICLYKNDEILPSPRWYKIMGVPGDMLHNKPELHLNVIIQPEQECIAASHLRGQFEDEEDESFADPNIGHHFELKLEACEEEEEEEEGEPKDGQQDLPTPKIEVIAEQPKAVVEPPQQKRISIPSAQSANTQAPPPPPVDADQYMKKLEDWKNEEKENFMAHLKKVENSFLESMFEEWQRKKHEEQNKLQWTIEECERLSKKLEDGYSQMKSMQRSEVDTQSLATAQAVIHEELGLERKRNAALELELREERDENKTLRNRIREMEIANAAAEDEIAAQIVSNFYIY